MNLTFRNTCVQFFKRFPTCRHNVYHKFWNLGSCSPSYHCAAITQPIVLAWLEWGCFFVPQRYWLCLRGTKKTFWLWENGFQDFPDAAWRKDTFISICSVETGRGRDVFVACNCEILINTPVAEPPRDGHSEVSRWDSPTFNENERDEEEEKSCFY